MTALCSDCRMQSLHCAITIIGGRQPARDGGVLANFPTFRLLDLSACWFFGVVADAGGGYVCAGVRSKDGRGRWLEPEGGDVSAWVAEV